MRVFLHLEKRVLRVGTTQNTVCTRSQSGVLAAPLGKLGRGGQGKGYRQGALWWKKPMSRREGKRLRRRRSSGAGRGQTREAVLRRIRARSENTSSHRGVPLREGPLGSPSEPPSGRISFH